MKTKALFVFGLLSGSIGCSMLSPEPEIIESSIIDIPVRYVDVPENPIPGTVDSLWAEPMINTIRVPARVDPSDTYYMPAHESIVEIQPGRYQKSQYPGDTTRPEGAK